VRAQLERERDETTVARLANLLRQTFFALGDRADIDEYFALQDTLPPIDLTTFAPFVTSIRPELESTEHRWVQWQPWLLSMGYQLYPRYQPDWVPSYEGKAGLDAMYHADFYGTGVSATNHLASFA